MRAKKNGVGAMRNGLETMRNGLETMRNGLGAVMRNGVGNDEKETGWER